MIRLPRFLKLPRFLWITLLILFISLPTFWSLLQPGYFKMHDDLQVVRVYEMTKCLKDFQIPCRWVPDMGYRFGYPQFNYYGPLPYYVMSFFNLFGLPLFSSVKLGFILPLLLGNIAIYYFAASLFGSAGGLVATLLYAYSPYRSSDIYSRGAMGETWAFIFFPIILLALNKLLEKPTLKKSIWLALSMAGLFVTHNISTLIFTPILSFWTIIYLYSNFGFKIRKMVSHIKFLSLSLILSVSLSAFFLLPVIFEKGMAHTETMIGGYFDYRAHFVTIKQLFFTSFWGYGSSEIGPTDDLSFFFSPIMLLLATVVTILLIRKVVVRQFNKLETFTLFLILSGLLAAFMSHEKSSFIWRGVAPLVYLQFPWRFLVTANFFLAVAAGYIFNRLSLLETKKPLIVIGLLTFLFSASFFRANPWYTITEQEKISGYLWDRQMTISIFDYLPTYAPMPPGHPADVLPLSSNRYSSITNFRKGTNWMDFTYESTSSSSLRLNLLNFPNWKITDNGQVVDTLVDKDGLIFVNLDQGTHHLHVKLTDSVIRLTGNILTFLSLIITVFLLIKKKIHV